ncbi:hypothetical protein ANN_17192 [Periplaneta americana]|uniref:Uncharacterized protein n=1 Tax=Periplaneta americana TaxID=6978 RepID=A0ABQ8STN3_PERAM|nr:hypothetical protein ANN_17192 [Periplaneta americana]
MRCSPRRLVMKTDVVQPVLNNYLRSRRCSQLTLQGLDYAPRAQECLGMPAIHNSVLSSSDCNSILYSSKRYTSKYRIFINMSKRGNIMVATSPRKKVLASILSRLCISKCPVNKETGCSSINGTSTNNGPVKRKLQDRRVTTVPVSDYESDEIELDTDYVSGVLSIFTDSMENDVGHMAPSTALACKNSVREIRYDCLTNFYLDFADNSSNFLFNSRMFRGLYTNDLRLPHRKKSLGVKSPLREMRRYGNRQSHLQLQAGAWELFKMSTSCLNTAAVRRRTDVRTCSQIPGVARIVRQCCSIRTHFSLDVRRHLNATFPGR